MKVLRNCGVAAAVAGLGMALSLPAFAQSPTVNVGGRIHLDAAKYDDDIVPLNDGVLVRRARLGANGTFGDGWGYKVEWDFAENDVAANDLFISYRGLGPGEFKLGQFKVPFGLNELTSSNAIMFIERSLGTEAFADARRLGAGYEHFEGNYGYQAMIYSRRTGSSSTGDQPLGVGGRFVFNPVNDDSGMVHLGIALAYESTDDADSVRFRARPESRAGGSPRLVDTGNIGNASSTLKLGLEAAWMAGPVSVEAEYMLTDVSRGTGDSDVDFSAFHIQGSYVLGGQRSYRGGRFRGVTPGAWELGLRYSWLDLNDGVIAGGEQSNVTLAVNYYATRNVRFMGNIIRVDQDDTGDKPWALAMRAQVSF